MGTTFADIVGQDQIKQQLQGAIENGKVSNAYLISGEARTGKEFIAKIFAKTGFLQHGLFLYVCSRILVNRRFMPQILIIVLLFITLFIIYYLIIIHFLDLLKLMTFQELII